MPIQITFQIMTDSDVCRLTVAGEPDFIDALMGVFETVPEREHSLNMLQRASGPLRARLDALVDTYAEQRPQLRGLRKRIGDLAVDRYFLLIPYDFESSLHKFKHEQLLASLNGTPLATAGSEALTHAFETLLSKYELTNPPNDRRTVIGERDPERKRCRFCGRRKSDGATFKKVAHAISEGLGNKHVVLTDECDACNTFFGDSIEPALIELFNVNRTYVGAKGKNGRPHVMYTNGSMTHDGSMILVTGRKLADDGNGRLSASLGASRPFAFADCYKALCKFALSVIPEGELEHLADTVAWIRSAPGEPVALPKIASCIMPFQSAVPDILVYTRRHDDDTRLPHVVCEFKLGPFVYVYKLPFSSRERDSPDEFFDDPDFKALFSHYCAGEWKLQDFSSTSQRPIDMTLNFLPRDASG